ncbi:unnamed protein product [Cuscuta campestris]|uniref:Retrotransposon gag domain-containing protein n=1 Tax=Cuscuta campestris TaxID=132261 RepID=A0A484LYG9_9ASTE|nr:unnamed protein product [Cuscuta campestris]
MSQAAGNDGQAVPEGELEHVSVDTEASSFTAQQASEQAVPGAGPVPEAVPIIQPQFAANFMNFLQQMDGAYVPPPPPPPPPVAVVTIEKLRKNGAEEFLGDQIADPMIAKRWFERTTRVLGNLRVPQEQRGDLAVALLQDFAYDWWKRVGTDIPEPVQWATFDRLFHEEYIPKHFVEAKREEFLKFTQAPRGDINALYKNALDLNVALVKKAEFEQTQGASTASSRPPPPQKSGTSGKRSFAVPSSSHQSKKAGHFCRDCPKNPREAFSSAPAVSAPAAQPAQSQKSTAASSQPKRQAPGAQAEKAPARTYAIRGRTEQPAHDVIMDLDNPVIMSNPLGHSLRLTHVYHDYPLVVKGKTFPASLIELPHREFDVILGMDWLTTNQAVVDCGAHTVRLRAEDGSDVLISSDTVTLDENLSYEEGLVEVLAREICQLRNKTIPLVKVDMTVQVPTLESSDDGEMGGKPHFILGMDWLTKRQTIIECGLRTVRQKTDEGDIVEVKGELFPKPPEFISYMQAKYRSYPSHVLPEGEVTLDESLTYEEEPIQILAREVKELRNKTIPLVKVLWRNHAVEEATWETEESMRAHGVGVSLVFAATDGRGVPLARYLATSSLPVFISLSANTCHPTAARCRMGARPYRLVGSGYRDSLPEETPADTVIQEMMSLEQIPEGDEEVEMCVVVFDDFRHDSQVVF